MPNRSASLDAAHSILLARRLGGGATPIRELHIRTQNQSEEVEPKPFEA